MPLDQSDTNVRIAEFGRRIELFLQDDIGAYLLSRANEHSEQAIQEFKTADPNNPSQIAAIQRKLLTADNFMSWLQDAVDAGHTAIEQLKQESIDG